MNAADWFSLALLFPRPQPNLSTCPTGSTHESAPQRSTRKPLLMLPF